MGICRACVVNQASACLLRAICGINYVSATLGRDLFSQGAVTLQSDQFQGRGRGESRVLRLATWSMRAASFDLHALSTHGDNGRARRIIRRLMRECARAARSTWRTDPCADKNGLSGSGERDGESSPRPVSGIANETGRRIHTAVRRPLSPVIEPLYRQPP